MKILREYLFYKLKENSDFTQLMVVSIAKKTGDTSIRLLTNPNSLRFILHSSSNFQTDHKWRLRCTAPKLRSTPQIRSAHLSVELRRNTSSTSLSSPNPGQTRQFISLLAQKFSFFANPISLLNQAPKLD